jgi:hypothetical protein
VLKLGSPVQTITTYRDPKIARRVILRLELLVPCTAVLHRTTDGASLQVDEEAVW